MDDATLSAFRLLLFELAKNGTLPDSSLAALHQSWRDSAQVFFDHADDDSGQSLMELSATAQGLQLLMKAEKPDRV